MGVSSRGLAASVRPDAGMVGTEDGVRVMGSERGAPRAGDRCWTSLRRNGNQVACRSWRKDDIGRAARILTPRDESRGRSNRQVLGRGSRRLRGDEHGPRGIRGE